MPCIDRGFSFAPALIIKTQRQLQVRVSILIDYSKKVLCKVSFDYGKKMGKISFVVKF